MKEIETGENSMNFIGKYVLVTGASTGIGNAITQVLVENGIHVFGNVRSEAAAEKMKKQWGADRVTPLIFDVRDSDAIIRAVEMVQKKLPQGVHLWGLVNNAGIAAFGPLALQPMEEMKEVLDINVLGAIQVTQKFLPLLGMERHGQGPKGTPGRIVNISSIAGKMGTPFLGIYAASKHAMEGWSESLRRELMIYGIDVVILGPGSVATPIWDKAESAGMEIYRGSDYEPFLENFRKYMLKVGRRGLAPRDLGVGVLHALSSKNPCVRSTMTPDLWTNWILPRMLPARWMDRWISKKLFKK